MPPSLSTSCPVTCTWGQSANQVPGVGVLPPGHVQRASRQADVAGRGLAQGGGDERRRRHRGLGQHRAVGEESADAVTEAGVEDGDHEAQIGVELLGPQSRVKVAQIVLAQQGQGPGRRHAGGQERLVIHVGALDHPHPGQAGDLRSVASPGRRQDDRDLLAVPECQLLGHSRGKRVIPAQHQMIATGMHGIDGHGAILARPGRTHPKGAPAATEVWGPWDGNPCQPGGAEASGDGRRSARADGTPGGSWGVVPPGLTQH